MAQAASGYVSQDTAPPPPSLRPHTQRGRGVEGGSLGPGWRKEEWRHEQEICSHVKCSSNSMEEGAPSCTDSSMMLGIR
jgi:hypothetical protein